MTMLYIVNYGKRFLDYLKAVKDESGNHRYFETRINNHVLECILMEI